MDAYSNQSAKNAAQPSRLQAFAARRIARSLAGLTAFRLRVELPGGYVFHIGPETASACADWKVRKWNALLRIAASGVLGFSEGYVHDEWHTSDLPGLLTALALELDSNVDIDRKNGPSRLLARLQHGLNGNTRRGSRRNIAYHYDLGNAFYRHWLDESMTYSSALFETDDESLEIAQTRKYRRICERLGLKPGDRVLEIGCGWGGFAEVAAREFGCHVTGLTLSVAQLDYARGRLEAANLADRVDFRLQDYRDVNETFDAIASIEMFEAVGEANWPTYYAQLNHCLKPGGRAALQVITIREDDFAGYRTSADFIQKYVFPGGMLPPASRLAELASSVGLAPISTEMFASSYAQTLARWHRAYRASRPDLEAMGFDAKFDRIWRFYLAYCEAGFTTGRIDVGHFVYLKPETSGN
ncbi:MAG: cyclopropane-fatty-acyl-phospholipid synthase [Maricaulis maris]|jgi:cyclopropane-fatty-acyl-phospholipid synthase|uniref:SAM-dependent methyltransferase n=1 Tax=Maricaulis TaxID=74317 RepID=UPI000C49E4CE|nr:MULTISPECIES: cyclopropane-fatty-acyl-phospholipid synthase family protein [Maricaulis]MAC89069.1 SAM-dependent methyltransferase [Maricaulis sp.]